MPILKPSDNPPTRPRGVASIRDVSGPWWVAHTKARAEKAFAWDLIDRDIPHFLPLVPRTTFSGGRKRHGMAALFLGYVFFAGDAEARHAALATDRLAGVVAVRDQSMLLGELADLERALDAGLPIDPYPELVVGERVRVIRGPMVGIVGTLVSKDDVSRLVLSVSLLGTAASVPVEASFLEAIDREPATENRRSASREVGRWIAGQKAGRLGGHVGTNRAEVRGRPGRLPFTSSSRFGGEAAAS